MTGKDSPPKSMEDLVSVFDRLSRDADAEACETRMKLLEHLRLGQASAFRQAAEIVRAAIKRAEDSP